MLIDYFRYGEYDTACGYWRLRYQTYALSSKQCLLLLSLGTRFSLKLHESMTNDMNRLEDENNLLQKRMQKTEKGYCTSKEFISAAATRLRGIDSSNMILSMLDLFVMRMAKQQFPTSK